MRIKPLYALVAAAALALPVASFAQSPAPALPSLTAEQSAQIDDQMATERPAMEARVARGEVTPDEAERFLAWRQWQIAQKITGAAPPPSAGVTGQLDSPPVRRYVYSYPAPYYYGPYYGPPGPYYWGPVVCAGGWGHHVGGRVCF